MTTPVRSKAMSAYDVWWEELTLQGDPARRPNLVREAFAAGEAGPTAELKYLRQEVRRLAHLVIRHNSDPAIMFAQWADDPTCCSTDVKGKQG